MSDIFEEVVDRWTSNDAWQFASREAAWGYFFMAGRESQQGVISAQCIKMNKYDGIVEALRAEIEALKQQVEQGKRDAGPEDIRKDAECWRDLVSHQVFNNKPQVGYAINRTKERIAAAPKQEK